MFKKIILSTLLVSGISFANQVVVGSNYSDSGKKFYEETNRGWHSYEDLPIEIIKKLEKMEKKIADLEKKKAAETPKPLGAKWIRLNLESYREKAIDDPTEENILTINLMEKVMREKAYNFAMKSAIVNVKYPVFNSKMANGNTTSLKDDFLKNKAKKELFKSLSKDKAFWFFYNDNCPKCVLQSGILQGVAEDYGWRVLAISIDGNPLPNGLFPDFVKNMGHAAELGVMAMPAIYLMDPKTLEISNIAQNVIIRDALIHRTIKMGHDMKWISDKDYDMTTKNNEKLNLSPKDIEKVDFDNPDQLNEALIDLLTKKGGF